MRLFIGILGITLFASCSAPKVPTKWSDLQIPKEGFVRVEKETDENGLYVEYRGNSREDLFKSVEQSLVLSGYVKVGTALDGDIIGFAKDKDQLAVKIDQFGNKLYLAIFNEKGKDPVLHGLVFGKFVVSKETELGKVRIEEIQKKQNEPKKKQE